MVYCQKANQKSYPFVLPALPFNKHEFMPYFSAETFEYHHEKHHQTYVTKLNDLIADHMELSDEDLEGVIAKSHNGNAAIFNNAAQVWNHSFFWHCLKVQGGGKASGDLLMQIEKDFGTYEKFATDFKQAAVTQFGSGWAWLVYKNGKLEVIKTANADTPITQSAKPILTIDVWEHAYYIDYRNNRMGYIDTYLTDMVNWQFAAENFANALN